MPVDITENFFFTGYSDGVYFNGKATANSFDLPAPTSTQAQGSVSGYASGGEVSSLTYVNTVDKFPFAADANATDVGDLTAGRRAGGGQSSSVSGYTSGGFVYPPVSNIIDKFPFATDANATDVGDLTTNRTFGAGQSSDVSGYTSGGSSSFPNNYVNTIDKFPFAADANATDVGDLTQVRGMPTGQQV